MNIGQKFIILASGILGLEGEVYQDDNTELAMGTPCGLWTLLFLCKAHPGSFHFIFQRLWWFPNAYRTVLDPRTNPNFSFLSNPLQAPYSQVKPHTNYSAFVSLLVLFPHQGVALYNSKGPSFIRGNVASTHWS